MADNWREITEEEEADIERHVTRVVRRVGSARIEIEDILRDLELAELNRQKQRAAIRKINAVLDRLDADLRVEAEDIPAQTFEHGRALALLAFGIAAAAGLSAGASALAEGASVASISDVGTETVGAAKRKLRSDRGMNNEQRALLANARETLTEDLLAATQNTRRHVKREIRRAAARTIREGEAGQQGARAQIRDLRWRLGASANLAITDRGGNTWKLNDYVEMAVRTKSAEMQVEGERTEALREGVQYGVVSTHVGACEKCVPWQGRILALTSDAPGDFSTIEESKNGGLWHPSCAHSLTMLPTFDLLPKRLRDKNGV
ncbi:phage minor capsid protein [Salibacterium lacus]|uniref:Phage minor capsid protein n=1 Tax=Salibacterium lacus TaxID=1898109 RepID=A0ABW5SYS0_9BACI